MSKRVSKLGWVAVAVMALAGTALAGRALLQRAQLAGACSNCQGAPWLVNSYSVLPDNSEGYLPGDGVKSAILTHNAVYTLDTMDTLVDGHVDLGSTRYVEMNFYSPVEGQFPGHNLPACWGGEYVQKQAVNWSVFSDNSLPFTKMNTGQSYPGRARMDFNVRNGACDRQIYRYYLVWSSVCITRTAATSWEAVSGDCGAQNNYGEANLQGQGGRKKETVNYGDWRLPFKLLLSAP